MLEFGSFNIFLIDIFSRSFFFKLIYNTLYLVNGLFNPLFILLAKWNSDLETRTVNE